jgi:hypothetical protein
MAAKPEWTDITILSGQEVKDHISKVVAHLKTIESPNIKAVADSCGAPYSRVYHRFHGRVSRYDREGPNQHLSVAQEESLCPFFNLLDDLGLSPRLTLVARSANELLAKNHAGPGAAPVISESWPFQFRERYRKGRRPST